MSNEPTGARRANVLPGYDDAEIFVPVFSDDELVRGFDRDEIPLDDDREREGDFGEWS